MQDRIIDETKQSEEQLFTKYKGIDEEGIVTPRHLLTFAKWILFVTAILYFLSAVSELIIPNNAVYETCKVTLPPIATLVIGYYFGSSKK